MHEFPASRIVSLIGPARYRGREHGESLRPQIHAVLERWKEFLAKENGLPADAYIRELLEETNFLPAIQKWTPDLLEELHGIAEGAALPFEPLLAFQLQDEEWWFSQERKGMLRETGVRCSSLGWRGRKAASLVAQNMDMPTFLDGSQVILRMRRRQGSKETAVFSVAGLLALNGMNGHSIGIVCNSLPQLKHSKSGLPVAFVLRGVLAQSSFSKAGAFLKNIPHASGQNYLLASRSRVIGYECSANQVKEYFLPVRTNRFCHTNHPFHNEDYRAGIIDDPSNQAEVLQYLQDHHHNSLVRFQTLQAALAGERMDEMGKPAAIQLLSSHQSASQPVCRHPEDGQGWMTLGTSIMLLGQAGQLWVCPGPPCRSQFSRVDL